MGLSRFRSIQSTFTPLPATIARSVWPDVPWRQPMTPLRDYTPSELSLLSPTNRSLFHLCAITQHVPDRATKSILRSLLRRSYSSAVGTLRRWMLPTVERGPPGSMRLDVG
jgi:hypothetical protein